MASISESRAICLPHPDDSLVVVMACSYRHSLLYVSSPSGSYEGTHGWNDSREAVKRQVNWVFNETRVEE